MASNGRSDNGGRSDRQYTGSTQYDQYGNPLDDGFGYQPELDDFVYDGTDDSGYGVPVDPDAYAASLGQTAQSDDYQYEGGGYQYYPEGGGAYPQGGGQVPQQPPKKRHHHRGLIILLVIVAAIVGLYVVICAPVDEQLAFSGTDAEVSAEESFHVVGMPYYVLALGSDAREGDTTSRTDTMMLVRIDPIASKLTIVSIPRDLYVEDMQSVDGTEDYGEQKINAAYAFGGAPLAAKTVSELTGVSLSHVAVVHFDQLASLIDAIGGITVTVPVDVNDPYYTGLVMSAGTYDMDGETAVLFARVRHGFATGDYQRQADQQLVVRAVMEKMLSLSPTELYGVVDELGQVVSTDMKLYEMLPLLLRFRLTSPTIYSCSITAEDYNKDGVAYLKADESEVRELMESVDAGQDPNATDANEAAASSGALSSTE